MGRTFLSSVSTTSSKGVEVDRNNVSLRFLVMNWYVFFLQYKIIELYLQMSFDMCWKDCIGSGPTYTRIQESRYWLLNKCVNPQQTLLLFSFFSNNIYRKRQQASAGFKLGSLETNGSTLTTRPLPPSRPRDRQCCLHSPRIGRSSRRACSWPRPGGTSRWLGAAIRLPLDEKKRNATANPSSQAQEDQCCKMR